MTGQHLAFISNGFLLSPKIAPAENLNTTNRQPAYLGFPLTAVLNALLAPP